MSWYKPTDVFPKPVPGRIGPCEICIELTNNGIGSAFVCVKCELATKPGRNAPITDADREAAKSLGYEIGYHTVHDSIDEVAQALANTRAREREKVSDALEKLGNGYERVTATAVLNLAHDLRERNN